MLGDPPHRHPIPCAAYQDRDARPLHRRPPQGLAGEAPLREPHRLAGPVAAHVGKRLQQRRQPYARVGNAAEAHEAQLRLEPAGARSAQAEHEPPAAQPVDVRGQSGGHQRAPVRDAAHHRPEPDPAGRGRVRCQRSPRVRQERRVVRHPQRVEAERVDRLRQRPARRPVDLGRPGGHLDAEPNLARALTHPRVRLPDVHVRSLPRHARYQTAPAARCSTRSEACGAP